MILIPATPAYSAPGAQGYALDIVRDPALLARVKKADPALYAKISAQSGDVRVRITERDRQKLKRFGATEVNSRATEFSSQKRKPAADFSSQQSKPATDFSSQKKTTLVVQPTVFTPIVNDLKAWSEGLANFNTIMAGVVVFFPPAAVIIAVTATIKLWVDKALEYAKAAEQALLAGKALAELPRCFFFFCR